MPPSAENIGGPPHDTAYSLGAHWLLHVAVPAVERQPEQRVGSSDRHPNWSTNRRRRSIAPARPIHLAQGLYDPGVPGVPGGSLAMARDPLRPPVPSFQARGLPARHPGADERALGLPGRCVPRCATRAGWAAATRSARNAKTHRALRISGARLLALDTSTFIYLIGSIRHFLRPSSRSSRPWMPGRFRRRRRCSACSRFW